MVEYHRACSVEGVQGEGRDVAVLEGKRLRWRQVGCMRTLALDMLIKTRRFLSSSQPLDCILPADIRLAQELPDCIQELALDERWWRRRNPAVQQPVVVLDPQRQDTVEAVQGEGRVIALLG